MKKILAVILALTFVFALCSCAKGGEILNSSLLGGETESTIITSSNENLESSSSESTQSKIDSSTESKTSSTVSNKVSSTDKTSSKQEAKYTSVKDKPGRWTAKYLTKKDLAISDNEEYIYLGIVLSPSNDPFVNYQHGILSNDVPDALKDLIQDGGGVMSDFFEGKRYYYLIGDTEEIATIEEIDNIVTLTLKSTESKKETVVLERKNETTMIIKEAYNPEIVGKKLMFLPQ